jgi:Fur family peroxide stress response transcriptional regulator
MADPKERFDSIIKKLRENDHKLTPQRLAVIKILAQSEGHPNVEKIYEQLHE